MLKRLFPILILFCCSSLAFAQIITVDFTARLNGGNSSLITEIAGNSSDGSNAINGSYTYDDLVSVYSKGVLGYVTPINTFTINYPNAIYSFDLNKTADSMYYFGTYIGANFYQNANGLNLSAYLSLDSYNVYGGVPPVFWMVAFQPDGSGFTDSGGAWVWYTNYQETIRAVPLPAGVWLFCGGMVYLAFNIRLKNHKIQLHYG